MNPSAARGSTLWRRACAICLGASLGALLLFASVVESQQPASGVPPQDGPASRSASQPPADDCLACHGELLSSSGHTAEQGQPCVACHVPLGPLEELEHLPMAVLTDQVCLDCHENWSTSRHPEVRAGRCAACHDPHQDRSDLDRAWTRPERQRCAPCHEDLERPLHAHTPFGRGHCSSCHDLHGGSTAKMLVEDSATSGCRNCHPDHARRMPNVEWPIAEHRCDECHHPHGSEHPAGAILGGAALCQECHDALPATQYTHGAVRLGRCSSCHPQHGVDHGKDLAEVEPLSALCFSCHADDIAGRPVIHEPVAAGQCAECHDAHGSAWPANLYEAPDEGCLRCHPEQDRRGVANPHAVVVGDGCTRCHDPHASLYPRLFRAPSAALCTSCHRGYDDGYHIMRQAIGGGHPYGEDVEDPKREDRGLDCTSCHDPHGSEHSTLFYRAETTNELCVECHEKAFRDRLGGASSSRSRAPQRQATQPPEPPVAPAPPATEPEAPAPPQGGAQDG